MPMPVPDPEIDFEGCLQALADNAIEEVAGLSDAERWRLYFDKAVGRLFYMRDELNLPDDDLLLLLQYARVEKLLIQRRTGEYPKGPIQGYPEWFP